MWDIVKMDSSTAPQTDRFITFFKMLRTEKYRFLERMWPIQRSDTHSFSFILLHIIERTIKFSRLWEYVDSTTFRVW